MTIDTSLFRGANVLITGVTGSLGNALSRELLRPEYGVKRLAGMARKWQPMEALERELNDKRFRAFIGDIRDIERLRTAFRGVDYVFHAAALKAIHYAEYDPRETLLSNCNGTSNVLQAAMECDVKRVMAISSDKACDPSSSYGASKKMTEVLAVGYNSISGAEGTRYAACRYGNVVRSAGSVIPLFEAQALTGKLTITNPKMSRFAITMPQAVEFVIKCMSEMLGGEIFIPKLPSTLVMDLVKAIAPEAEIELIGLRPAEKMHEAMVSRHESHRTKELDWAFRIEPSFTFWDSDLTYPGGSPVGEGWEYNSASAIRLTVDEIKGLL